MNIAILTIGSRGDIQPYAVLGKALKDNGHNVTLATASNFKKLVESYGIAFRPVEADIQAVVEGEDGKKMLKGNPFAIRRNLKKWVYPLIRNSLMDFYLLSKESDLVLYHVKTLADSFADCFPEKMIRASVLPIVEPTVSFPNPAFSGLPIPAFLNKASYFLSAFSIKLLSTPIGDFRKAAGLSRKASRVHVRNIYGLSPAFIPTPADYPPYAAFKGFWFSDSKPDLPPAVTEFLSAGAPPVVITFGSMPFQVRFDIQTALKQLAAKLAVRFIVVKGWGFRETEKLEGCPDIMVVDAIPYESLFPLVKAVIHHGGIGTTAECVRAGVPFWICPVLYPVGDQMFWGRHSWKTGIGVRPVPLRKLERSVFEKGVEELVTNRDLYAASSILAAKISAENGCQAVVSEIEAYVKHQ